MTNFDAVIAYGSAVKSFPQNGPGAYAGCGLRFSQRDQQDDVFVPEPDGYYGLKPGDTIRTHWRHGLDPVVGHKELCRSSFEMRREGIWFWGKLDLDDPIQERINRLILKGKVGFSTGSLSHLVVRKRQGNVNFLRSWPIGDLSMSPTPVEPQNKVLSLKSLVEGETVLSQRDLDLWESQMEQMADNYARALGEIENGRGAPVSIEQRAAAEHAKFLGRMLEWRMQDLTTRL